MITNLRNKLDRLALEQDKPVQKCIKHDISAYIGARTVEKSNGGYLLRTVKYKIGDIYGDYIIENIEEIFSLNEKLLFIDTETTGLGSVACPFLIGVAHFDCDNLILEQYFMRDIDDESAVLEDIIAKYSGMTVVSYNGKCFDVPLIKARCTINEIKTCGFAEKQTDLLHLSRRIWKKRLENCRLATIEEEILKVHRDDDIPGSLIPEMYKKYLDTGNPYDMQKVIEHNESDVVTMSVLLAKIIRIDENPIKELKNTADIMHLGEFYYAKKQYKRSLECFEFVLRSETDAITVYNCMKYLSFIHKKNKNYVNAVDYWNKMDRLSLGASLPLIELAKYYEHIEPDCNKALACAKKAKYNAIMYGANDLVKEINIRIDRLNKKCTSKENKNEFKNKFLRI